MKEGTLITTNTYSAIMTNDIYNVEILSRNLIDGKLEIICRQKSNIVYACNPPRPAPDYVWKEIYGVVDGKLCLVESIKGTHKPAEYIQESFSFYNELT